MTPDKDPFNPNVHRSSGAPYPHTDFGDGQLPTGDRHYNLSIEESQLLAQKRGVPLQRGNDLPPSVLSDEELRRY